MADTITGTVARVTYQNEQNGYCVLKIEPERDDQDQLFDKEHDRDQRITVTGNLLLLKEGEKADFTGEWETHKKYGTYLAVDSFHVHSPTSTEGLKRFLASDHFKGIGESYAQRLVEMFGEKLPHVIEQEPDKLARVNGITREKAATISKAWEDVKQTREMHISLQGIGLTPNLAQKVIDRYHTKALDKLKENPYQLAQDIWGVGFSRSDEIAQGLGFAHDHPHRIQSGIAYTLVQAVENGHMYLPMTELVESAQKMLGINEELVQEHMFRMLEEGDLIQDNELQPAGVYLRSFYEQEEELAELLIDLLRQGHESSVMKDMHMDEVIALLDELKGDITLASEQRAAIKTTLMSPVSVLTGGPGTGKSTTVNTLLEVITQLGKSSVLAAPTGRAAKRLTEISGREAFTLHRLLKIQPGGFAEFDQEKPLPYDFIIIDETSMLDAWLAGHLLKSIRPGSHLLLVGDADQLPSVQAGNVLQDIIDSKQFPTVELQKIFRQAEESAIVRNAHKMKQGSFPDLPEHPTDFYLFEAESADEARDLIVEVTTQRIPKEFGFKPQTDVQVLAPLYKTAAGVSTLNDELQRVINPKRQRKQELQYGYTMFREGDRVMQLRNNYEKEVYNGDVGQIQTIEKNSGTTVITVGFENNGFVKAVSYENEEVSELTLAYAVSVHKSQGSEYPVVVMPVITSHYIMLQRNLLYTGITRAKELVVLVGSKKALYIALNNDEPQKRYSGLKEKITRSIRE